MLTKKEFNQLRYIIAEHGEEFRRYGLPAYKLDKDTYTYQSDAGYIQGLVFGGHTYEEFDINQDLRIRKTEDWEILKED